MDKALRNIIELVRRTVENELGLTMDQYLGFLESPGHDVRTPDGRELDRIRQEKLDDMGDLITVPLFKGAETWDHIRALYIAFVRGYLPQVPTHFGPLDGESHQLRQILEEVTRKGVVTINGQPGDCDERIKQREYQEFFVNKKVTDVQLLYNTLRRRNMYVHAVSQHWDNSDMPKESASFAEDYVNGEWKPAGNLNEMDFSEQFHPFTNWRKIANMCSPMLNVKKEDIVYFRLVNKTICDTSLLSTLSQVLSQISSTTSGRGNPHLSPYDIERQCTSHRLKRDCAEDPACNWTPRKCIRTWDSLNTKMYQDPSGDWWSPQAIQDQCSVLNKRTCGTDPACNWRGDQRGCTRVDGNYFEPQYLGPFTPAGGWPAKSIRSKKKKSTKTKKRNSSKKKKRSKSKSRAKKRKSKKC